MHLFSHVGDFEIVLFGLYWRIWSKLMMLSGEKSTGDWRFEKSVIDSFRGEVGVDFELEMVKL